MKTPDSCLHTDAPLPDKLKNDTRRASSKPCAIQPPASILAIFHYPAHTQTIRHFVGRYFVFSVPCTPLNRRAGQIRSIPLFSSENFNLFDRAGAISFPISPHIRPDCTTLPETALGRSRPHLEHQLTARRDRPERNSRFPQRLSVQQGTLNIDIPALLFSVRIVKVRPE